MGGTEGVSNTFYGQGAGNNATGDDDYDTFLWLVAGYHNTTGNNNTFLGVVPAMAITQVPGMSSLALEQGLMK